MQYRLRNRIKSILVLLVVLSMSCINFSEHFRKLQLFPSFVRLPATFHFLAIFYQLHLLRICRANYSNGRITSFLIIDGSICLRRVI